MKVLYVEDSSRDADLTVRILNRIAPHLLFETVPTIQDALTRLERLGTEPLDLVLADMHLRDGDGLSLLRYIRESGLPLAVVVVTGMGDEETAVAALKTGADDYVVKRTDYLDRLPIILESALNHYRADAVRRTHPLNVLYAEPNSADIENMRRHFAAHADHIHLQVVSDGAQLLSEFDRQNGVNDAVLMEFQLPQLNALEVLRELRHRGDQDVPVVLLCNESEKELARQGLELGATSLVVKSPGYLYQLPWELEQAHSRAESARRETALRESESRLRLAQQAARVGTWEWDIPTGESVWSEMIWHLLGLEPGEGESTLERFAEFIHPDDRDGALSRVNEVIARGEEYSDEFRIVRKDGEVLWVASQGRLIRSSDGQPERMIGVNIDINKRKLAEESLKTALLELGQLKDRLHEENIYLKEEIKVASDFGELIGQSESLTKVLHLAEQVAPLDTTVLILGETGTGKELLAHAIHSRSPRHNHALVKVNCATLPGDLIESELFGHDKGAFTGATARRVGRFEIANGGTIFLDEVGELPLDLQAKLLRVLQEGEFEPVGSSRTVRVDVRIIAATNRDLEDEVRKGLFRADLFYRLSIFPITLPPLRERKEDIPILARHFVKEYSRKFGKEIDSISKETMATFRNYPWPGNIRELKNVIERAVIVTQGTKLHLLDSFGSAQTAGIGTHGVSDSQDSSNVAAVGETLEQSQYNLILQTLNKSYWRIEGPYGAAAALKVHPSKLRALMKKLGITRPKMKAQGSNNP